MAMDGTDLDYIQEIIDLLKDIKKELRKLGEKGR